MSGNKPEVLKVFAHLERIKSELNKFTSIPYGGSNPYSYCSSCRSSLVQGHDKSCKSLKFNKIETKLEKRLRKETKNFLKRKEFNSKSFINYCWLKKKEHVSGLDHLIKTIIKYLKENPTIDARNFLYHNQEYKELTQLYKAQVVKEYL